MATLKERLASVPDITEKAIETEIGVVRIRRLTVRERDLLLKDHKTASTNGDGRSEMERGSAVSRQMVAAGMVDPSATYEELLDMPAAFVESIAKEIMAFNGWSVQGRAALDDSFRPPAGSAI